MAESHKERIMRILNVDESQADEILACDKAIDKGERVYFDLDREKEKEAKKMANVNTHKKPIMLDRKPRERKANPTKSSIIAELVKFLSEQSENACENVTATNAERQIAFSIGDHNYELTLVQKRASKS